MAKVSYPEWVLAFKTAGTCIRKNCNKGSTLIFDGKGARAAARKIKGERTPYVLNVVDSESELCICSLRVGSKENEKVTFHEALNRLTIEGSMVLADAMATDELPMRRIYEEGADFTFQVGYIGNDEILFVVYTERDKITDEGIEIDITRLISVRLGNNFVRGVYYANRR